MKEKEQQEWQRVLSNPDNVIVSDWLLDQLDPGDIAAEISNPKVVYVTGEITFETQTIKGALVSFASDDREIACVFSLALDEWRVSLFNDRLRKIHITASNNDEAWTLDVLPEDEDASIVWNRESEHEALLSIVVKKHA